MLSPKLVLAAQLAALMSLMALPGIPRAAAGQAADFSLRNLEGQAVTLSQFRGKVVVMSFWATWCVPCQQEMPHLEKMWKEFGPLGLVILGISEDDAKADAMVKPRVKALGVTYTILRDPQTTVVAQFNPSKSLPFTAVVDRMGALASTHAGYAPGDEAALRIEVEALLAKPAP